MIASNSGAWNSDVNVTLQKCQDLQKRYHDVNACELLPLVPEQPVHVYSPITKQWSRYGH